jgi:4-carboxymuconolactone decarboxylase
MKLAALMPFALVLAGNAYAQSQPQMPAGPQAQQQSASRPSGPLQQKLAPGLAAYTDEVLFGEVWPGPGLTSRDRSLVVISVLIATNKPAQLQGHLGRALNNGVTPVEASGVLTHLALYAGWPSAVSALEVYDQVYTARKIDFAALQAAVPALPPAASDGARTDSVLARFGSVAPKFAELTNRVVFDDLWRRSDLSVRDRSLVTIAALAAMGDADLLDPYLRRGVAAGLSRAEIAEAMTHLAFYAGWGKATKALDSIARTSAAGAEPKARAGPAEVSGRIWRKGSPPITAGPATNFTGAVQVLAPYRGTGGSRLGGATVMFQPGARSAWHRHPMGQALIVTEGCGWTQAEGGPIEKICAGDVAWIGPGERHWHGATPTTAMTHVTASESLEGQSVEWLEKVSDEEYARGPL